MYSGWNHIDSPDFSTNVASLIMTFTSCYLYCFRQFHLSKFHFPQCCTITTVQCKYSPTLFPLYSNRTLSRYQDQFCKLPSSMFGLSLLLFFSEETNEPVDNHALQTNDTVNWFCPCINSPRHKTLTDNMVFS